MPSRREVLRRAAVGVAVATALGAGALAWSSTLLGEYSVMSMGSGQDGGGQAGDGHSGHAQHSGAVGVAHGASGTFATGGDVSVTSLTADPDRPADVEVELTARQETIDVPGGRAVEGYTVNGSSPGPELRAQQGDLIEVTFRNESVTAGATLHWHGIDVPNAADGVAGITQDAVPAGGHHVYRFVAEDAGTYWYHSHQVSREQVLRGLLGALVIDPVAPADAAADLDITALLHVYGGQHTLNGRVADERIDAPPGSTVRVRVINSDQGTAAVWSDSPFRVIATDGRDINEPTDLRGQRLLIPAGGRADVAVQAPQHGSAALHVGGARRVLIGDPEASVPSIAQPSKSVDLLSYGAPEPLGFDPSSPDRSYDYVIARRFGLIDGRPGNFWTINGRMFPDVPMFHVAEGDVVVMRIVNESGEVHPMHLHGHHIVVLSREGTAASGSPWWVDSLDVRPGESYEIAFIADNPGIWSDHCHTLPHAVDGLVAHLMYDGVTTPFTIHGSAGNQPE
ncbi:multicopper oxidase family protein [Agromyces subbeticus]|uniref:multicopper oxidase family protein n=1 Tax=Agromyces subbeticus TaxID=293890 RepID=UPI0003B2E88F|nr:multicopper oxidase family protein [Agromyces subbeticus]